MPHGLSSVGSHVPLACGLRHLEFSNQNKRKAFNEIDTDRNGTVTFDEFANSDWALNL